MWYITQGTQSRQQLAGFFVTILVFFWNRQGASSCLMLVLVLVLVLLLMLVLLMLLLVMESWSFPLIDSVGVDWLHRDGRVAQHASLLHPVRMAYEGWRNSHPIQVYRHMGMDVNFCHSLHTRRRIHQLVWVREREWEWRRWKKGREGNNATSTTGGERREEKKRSDRRERISRTYMVISCEEANA